MKSSSSLRKPSPRGSSEVISLNLLISLFKAGMPPIPVLSWANKNLAIFHPAPSSPMRFSTGTLTLSK